MGRCPACGEADTGDHRRCAFDPPRFCAECGRRLRVQVFPLEYRATCPSCSPRAKLAHPPEETGHDVDLDQR